MNGSDVWTVNAANELNVFSFFVFNFWFCRSFIHADTYVCPCSMVDETRVSHYRLHERAIFLPFSPCHSLWQLLLWMVNLRLGFTSYFSSSHSRCTHSVVVCHREDGGRRRGTSSSVHWNFVNADNGNDDDNNTSARRLSKKVSLVKHEILIERR